MDRGKTIRIKKVAKSKQQIKQIKTKSMIN